MGERVRVLIGKSASISGISDAGESKKSADMPAFVARTESVQQVRYLS